MAAPDEARSARSTALTLIAPTIAALAAIVAALRFPEHAPFIAGAGCGGFLVAFMISTEPLRRPRAVAIALLALVWAAAVPRSAPQIVEPTAEDRAAPRLAVRDGRAWLVHPMGFEVPVPDDLVADEALLASAASSTTQVASAWRSDRFDLGVLIVCSRAERGYRVEAFARGALQGARAAVEREGATVDEEEELGPGDRLLRVTRGDGLGASVRAFAIETLRGPVMVLMTAWSSTDDLAEETIVGARATR